MKDKRILIVDYGGVLGHNHLDFAENKLAETFNVSRNKICELLSEKSEQGILFRENKISETMFWNIISEKANLINRPPNNELSLLWAKTYELNTELSKLLSHIQKSTPIGILTNIDKARSHYLLNNISIVQTADFYFPSYKYGFVKSKKELWEIINNIILEKFNNDAIITYVDDRKEHIDTCKLYGWDGLLFKNMTQLKNDLVLRNLI
jgi:FMN phosphatase YigB (HAD superfamily)